MQLRHFNKQAFNTPGCDITEERVLSVLNTVRPY